MNRKDLRNKRRNESEFGYCCFCACEWWIKAKKIKHDCTLYLYFDHVLNIFLFNIHVTSFQYHIEIYTFCKALGINAQIKRCRTSQHGEDKK